jgi:hypothetical protein
VQGQRPFKQDDGDREGNQGKQQIPQQLIGIEQTGHRAEQEAAQQQEQNGGNAHGPGKPLGEQGDEGYSGEGESNHANLVQVMGLDLE